MHPAVGLGIAAAATAAFFAILKISFIVTGMLIVCAAAFASAIAVRVPRFAVIVMPITALMVAHHDVFEISRWSIWWFFSDNGRRHDGVGHGLGYAYQYLIFSFMILGTLAGLQRRHNGNRPFLLSGNPVTFNGAFWQPEVTPLVGWWLLSTAIAIAAVALVPSTLVRDVISGAIHAIHVAADWTWHDFLQFSTVFDFHYFCDNNIFLNYHCNDIYRGRGWFGYFTIYPIGIFWIAGFVAAYLVLVLLAAKLPPRLRWLGLFWFLAGPAIPLFLLTTTYGLHLGYWGTYVAWGLYAAFVVRTLWRRHQGSGRAGLWSGLRWGGALLATLLLASDVDWVLKQRLGRNLFGVGDTIVEFERMAGRPGVAWGGLPRMALGFSPTELVVERVVPMLDRNGETSRPAGASTPSAPANGSGGVPSAGTTRERVVDSSLPLPPPAPPAPPRAPEAGGASRPAGSATGEPVPPSRPATQPQAAAQGLLGQPKEPPSGPRQPGVNPR